MVRQAREMIAAGEIGDIRVVHAAYIQDWLTLPIDADGQKQAEWRTDPARAGASACLADIGVHAHNLALFVTGLELDAVSADLTTFVPGRRLDDNAHVLMRFARRRARRAAGEPGRGRQSQQSEPQGLRHARRARMVGREPGNAPLHALWRADADPAARRPGKSRRGASDGSRMPAGHPEGYIEGFANLYRDAARLIPARRAGQPFDPLAAASVPT